MTDMGSDRVERQTVHLRYLLRTRSAEQGLHHLVLRLREVKSALEIGPARVEGADDVSDRDSDKSLAPAFGDFHGRSEEHTSELQSLMRISYAVFCLKKKKKTKYPTRIKYVANTHSILTQ